MANATVIRHILDDEPPRAEPGERAERDDEAVEMMRPLDAWGYSISVDLDGSPQPVPRSPRRRGQR